MEEVWKDIPGFEGKYRVSDQGRVFSCRSGRILEGSMGHYYREVALGRGYRMGVHVVVAKAFPEICGEWFEGCCVHHINENKMDNRPENIRVMSHSEHSKLHYDDQPDSFKKPSEKRSQAISKALKGRSNDAKHIPIIQLTKDGKFVKRWDFINQVAESGFSPGNVCSALRGQLKTAYGFVWQYAVSD